jgi:leucyl-tRNA synthetase
MKFNTALAALMELANHFSKLPEVPAQHWEILLRLLAPFAPHIGEELWQRLGKTDLLHSQPWPEYDNTYIAKDTVDIPIQVDGRLRQKMNILFDATDKEIESRAFQAVAGYYQGKEVKKVIIARRESSIMVNIVTQA